MVTIRAILPVYANGHELSGILVLNADYEKLLSQAFEDIIQSNSVFVINYAGDYLVYSQGGTISDLEFHDHYSVPPPEEVELVLNEKEAEKSIIGDENISHFVRVGVSEANPDAEISVMVQSTRKNLLAGAYIIRRDSMILTSILVITFMFLAFIASRKLIEPLSELTNKIIRSRESSEPLILPTSATGEIGNLAKAFQDLTDSHVESEHKLRSIISNIGEGIITIDEYGTIESYNPACAQIFGYDEREVIGQNVGMLMTQGNAAAHDGYLSRYKSIGKRKIDWVGREEIGQHKSGASFSIELTVTELYLEGRRVFVGIVRDITERQVAEKAKSEFIAIISHELRTPLTSIKGALGLMASGSVEPISEKMQKIMDIALRNSDRLARLINDILDFEKLTSGNLELEQNSVDLALIVEEAVEANKGYGLEYDVNFVCEGVEEPVLVKGDAHRLIQILANLLSNAAKFSLPGGQVTVALSRHENGEGARISVKDNGLGIPEHAKSTIFDKFTQVDSSSQRAKGGSGLGLGIAKFLVERHGGQIGFTSKEGVGTTFYVDFDTISNVVALKRSAAG